MRLPPEFEDGSVLTRSVVEMQEVEDGVIEGIAVPYEVETELLPGIYEVFTKGAFAAAQKDPGRVKLRGVGHDRSVIGHALSVEDMADGVHVRMKVVDTSDGMDALKLMRAGSIDVFSCEFVGMPRHQRVSEDRRGLHVRHDRARLVGVSPVPEGAYGRAASIVSVRDSRKAALEFARIREREFWSRIAKM